MPAKNTNASGGSDASQPVAGSQETDALTEGSTSDVSGGNDASQSVAGSQETVA
jgi:hypothetical protein